MGLFSWLFGGGGSKSAPDGIWLTQDAKCRGMARHAAEVLEADPDTKVCVVAHFPATLEEIRDAVDWPRGVQFLLTAGAAGSPGLDSLHTAHSEIEFMVAERHFCRDEDDYIEKFCDQLSVPCSVRFHLSLEDPMMHRLVDGMVASMLESLGMTEQEMIESSMVSRRIAAAQNQVCPDSSQSLRANSANEWLQVNGHRTDS